MQALQIITKYITYFERQKHKQIANSSLVPLNDPTTLFTSSGMQPLVPYLLGEVHPQGTRLVNVQNCFRAQDIDEIGDNRHTTFFRMIGNWSLGDYFKNEQLHWFFEFLTDKHMGLNLNPEKLYVTVFNGFESISKDTESINIWKEIFTNAHINAEENKRIFAYGTDKNWWSRSGLPEKMPIGEPGGPDSEVFYDYADESIHKKSPYKNLPCHVNCDCGRYVEIGNSVFMQYQRQADGTFNELPKRNVDFGGGLERLIAATEHQADIFQTSLFKPIIMTIESLTSKPYENYAHAMRIITDHFVAASFILSNDVIPSNKEQGYILRRLIRRGFDNLSQLGAKDATKIIETLVGQYKATDPILAEKYEHIVFSILEEIDRYSTALTKATSFIEKKYGRHVRTIETADDNPKKEKLLGDELMGIKEISSEDAFYLYASHGLSPTQIKSLGYSFDEQAFAKSMQQHQKISKLGAEQKFRGGLADHQERTIMGHTATHLLHQALRDILGSKVHQTGSNITTERLRFDFNYDQKLTDEQIQMVEQIVNDKIKENLPVHFDLLPLNEAKDLGAIGLFDEKYEDKVKIYFIGGKDHQHQNAYSKEFCGGPHVDFTGKLKSFKIIKQENIGNKQRRIYAVTG